MPTDGPCAAGNSRERPGGTCARSWASRQFDAHMIAVLSLMLLGFFLGMRHATDPDHVIAVSTIVIPPRLGLTMEMAVALMLIALGMWNLTGILEHIRGFRPTGEGNAGPLHAHAHSHGDYVHSHPSGPGSGQHGHSDDQTPVAWLDRQLGGLGVYQILRPLFIGLVHGLAGSAAVALLVLALIKNPWWAIAYLVLFGIGTIAGMMLITTAIGAK